LVFDKYGTDRGRSGIQRLATLITERNFSHAYICNPSTRNRALMRRAGVRNVRECDHSVAVRDGGYKSRSILKCIYSDFAAVDIAALPSIDRIDSEDPILRSLPKSYLAIAPGSVWQTKCWPVERYIELAKALVDNGENIVLVGSSADAARAKVIAECVPDCIDLTGRTSLPQVAAILRDASRLIANDSAPVHIACAVRTPVTVIFGPTIPAFGFAPPGAMIIESEEWCRPCTSHGPDVCPIHTHQCMMHISVERVLESLPTFDTV